MKTLLERVISAQAEATMLQVNPESVRTQSTLADLDDFDMLPGVLGEHEDGDGLLKLSNEVELSYALWIASNVLGFNNSIPGILEKVQHERQHAEAALALGLSATYALHFALRENGRVAMKSTTLPSGRSVSKLEFASILAHPQRLSNSDLRQLQAIGYQDAGNVASRIIATNSDIPVPLSARL